MLTSRPDKEGNVTAVNAVHLQFKDLTTDSVLAVLFTMISFLQLVLSCAKYHSKPVSVAQRHGSLLASM